MIATATDTVIGSPIPVGSAPEGLAVTPDGSKVYVANGGEGTVSVIATATNTVTGSPITVGSQPGAFGIFIANPLVQSAPASGKLCNGVYDGTFAGNITVSAGQSCVFINGGEVQGNVTVLGGNFGLIGAAVDVSVTVDGGGSFTLGPGATIGVNLTIANLPPSTAANNSVCGSTVRGNLTVNNNAAAIEIGSNAPMVCAGNKIGGNLYARANTAAVQIFDNSVGNNATALSNTGPLDVVGNKVHNILQCVGNTMLIMGSGNTAAIKQGQCS